MAGAIALVLLIAAAAMLPMAMRLGQGGTAKVEVEVAESPRGAIAVSRVRDDGTTATATTTGRVLAMNERAVAPPAPMVDADEGEDIGEPKSAGAPGEPDVLVVPAAPQPAAEVVPVEQAPTERPPAIAQPDDEHEFEPEPEPVQQQAGLLIDLNTAGASELQLLPGIGPAMAARIIEDRATNGPFASMEALDRVRGIGPRTIENLRGKAMVSGVPATGAAPPDADRLQARIPINTATAEELDTLPGIGPALAARIIEDRQTNGPFRTIDDLQRVRGIGPKTIERLRPLITVRIPADRR